MRRSILLCLLLVSICQISHAQLHEGIKGLISLSDTTDRDISDGYQVFVQDGKDMLLYDGFFNSKKFEIPASDVASWKQRSIVVTVSLLGYERMSIPLNLSGYKGEELVFRLVPSELQTLVVKASRPKAKIVDGKLQIKIPNTYLAHVGSLKKLLSLTPGIIQTREGIKVIGAGTPVIMINNRKARPEEIQSLRSKDILSVEIDRQPTAEFAPGTKAVIRITTKEKLSDLTEIILNSEARQAARFSHEQSVQSNISRGPIKAMLRAGYGYWQTKLDEQNAVSLFNKSGEIYFSDSTSSDSWSKSHSFDFSGALEYYFTPNHFLGLSYMATRDKEKDGSDGEQFNFLEGIHSLHHPQSVSKDCDRYHAATLYYYNASVPKHRIYLTASYIKKKQDTDYAMWLKDENDNRPFADYDRKYNYNGANVYAKYTYSPSEMWNISLGTSDSRLTNRQTILNANSPDATKTLYPRLYNLNSSTYTEILFNKDKISASASARYEYNYTKYEDEKKNTQTYQNFYPSLYIKYSPKEDYQFSLRYTYYSKHPSYSSLDPQKYYQNRFVYSQGNPMLKSEKVQQIAAAISLWQQANVSLSYRHKKDPISFIAKEGDHPNSIKMYSVNTGNMDEWNLMVEESADWKSLSLYISASISTPQVQIYRGNDLMKKTYVSYDISSMLSWTPNAWFSAYLGFDYFSKSYSNFNIEDSRNNLKAGLNWTVKDRLNIGLEANDILQGMNFGRWEMHLPNLDMHQDGTSDMRSISLTLSYRFGNAKAKARNIHGGDEIKSRL